jgi:short-subunit dehydrogenase
MAGLLSIPYRGIYSASKHALEGYTEALDHDVRQFGVRAVLIEPAFTKTRIETNRKPVRAPLGIYSEQEQRVNEAIAQKTAHGDQARSVAEAVCAAVEASRPRQRYPVGGGKALSRLRRFIPERMFDQQFRKQFHLDMLNEMGDGVMTEEVAERALETVEAVYSAESLGIAGSINWRNL